MPQSGFTPLRITRPVLSRSLRLAMREWARVNGYPVSDRGRVADRIVEAFLAANPDAYEQAGKIEIVRAAARVPCPSPEGFDWQRNSRLGPIYTVVFVRGIDEYEILRRLDVAAEDIRTILNEDHSLPEGPQIITVTQAGDWAIAVEECG